MKSQKSYNKLFPFVVHYVYGTNGNMNISFLFVLLLSSQVQCIGLYFVNVDTNLPRSIHFYAYNFVITRDVLLILAKYALNCENAWFELYITQCILTCITMFMLWTFITCMYHTTAKSYSIGHYAYKLF